MDKLILIGFGGFIGSVMRYLVSGYVQTISRSNTFPYGTLAVNVIGSFIIGFLFYFIETRSSLNPQMRALLLFGFLGAFTTFSTFSLETYNLLRSGELVPALMNVGANCVLGVMAVWAGRTLPMMIWR